jgi:hypothetical protein
MNRRQARSAIAGAVLTLAIAALGYAVPARAADLTVTVGDTPVTAPLPDDFLGLALEFNTVPRWTARGRQAPDATFDALLHNLSPVGTPSIRIGGQSTDRSRGSPGRSASPTISARRGRPPPRRWPSEPALS